MEARYESPRRLFFVQTVRQIYTIHRLVKSCQPIETQPCRLLTHQLNYTDLSRIVGLASGRAANELAAELLFRVFHAQEVFDS